MVSLPRNLKVRLKPSSCLGTLVSCDDAVLRVQIIGLVCLSLQSLYTVPFWQPVLVHCVLPKHLQKTFELVKESFL